MNEKVKKLEALLEKLTNLYYEANDIEEDSDTSRAISCAEDTLMMEIKFEKARLNDVCDI
jgi:hypothetical protein